MSEGEEILAFHLKAAGIPFEREYRFAPPRRWRFDFLLKDSWAVEVEGGAWTGGHKRGAAARTDTEKANEALLMGFKVLRFTPNQVEEGTALKVIERALTPSTSSVAAKMEAEMYNGSPKRFTNRKD